MTTILIPVSPAELIDKITILRIKKERITDTVKLGNVTRELELLETELAKFTSSPELAALTEKLQKANEVVWDAEEEIREMWEDDRESLKQARIAHSGNDQRFKLKRGINELLGSGIIEEKSHQG